MTRLSLVEFVCIVVIGIAMVEFAAGDRQARETNASALVAKVAAATGADGSNKALPSTVPAKETSQQIGRRQ
jgi:hypothetical protein